MCVASSRCPRRDARREEASRFAHFFCPSFELSARRAAYFVLPRSHSQLYRFQKGLGLVLQIAKAKATRPDVDCNNSPLSLSHCFRFGSENETRRDLGRFAKEAKAFVDCELRRLRNRAYRIAIGNILRSFSHCAL